MADDDDVYVTSTTAPPETIEIEKGAEVMGMPQWAFGSIMGLIVAFCLIVPILVYLRRIANTRKPYTPDNAPNIDAFAREIIQKTSQSGVLGTSRLARQ